jgi:hypothetical protein
LENSLQSSTTLVPGDLKKKALFVKFVAYVRKKSAFGFFTAFIPVLFKRK